MGMKPSISSPREVALQSLPLAHLLRIQMLLLPEAESRKPRAGSREPEAESRKPKAEAMTHAQLVEKAVHWLRRYRCGVVLSEQACVSGEMPDAIGWKRACHSVLVECKVTRSDFLADRAKPFRLKPEQGVGCERFYFAPAGLVRMRRTAPRLGTAGTQSRQSRNEASLGQESPHRHRLSLRNESAARQPAPRRGPRRTAKHY